MAQYIPEPVIFSFTTPAAVWEVEHKFNRPVRADVFNSSGEIVYPRVLPDSTDPDNKVIISFFVKDEVPYPMTGEVRVY